MYFVIKNNTYEIVKKFEDRAKAEWWLTDVFGPERFDYEVVLGEDYEKYNKHDKGLVEKIHRTRKETASRRTIKSIRRLTF